MGIRLDKSETPVTPETTTPQVDGVFIEQRIERGSVPISVTLPSAQKPAERPNQPTNPTNEEPNQPTNPTNEEPNQPSSPSPTDSSE